VSRPTQEAEDAWVQTIIEMAQFNVKFLEACTPGYYNNEGRPAERSVRNGSYGGGSPAFIRVLESVAQRRPAGRPRTRHRVNGRPVGFCVRIVPAGVLCPNRLGFRDEADTDAGQRRSLTAGTGSGSARLRQIIRFWLRAKTAVATSVPSMVSAPPPIIVQRAP
jgi:hypothetical protein